MKRSKRKALQELFDVLDDIFSENDSPNPKVPRAGTLPAEWRAPLVKAVNRIAKEFNLKASR